MADVPLSPAELEALTEFLHGIPLFANLRPLDLDTLVRQASKAEYPAGSILYRQSDADNSLYIIYAGTVGLTHIDPQGAPNDVGTRGPGDWLGESSALLGEPHDVTAIAVTPTTVLVFTRDDFKTLFAADAGFRGRLSPKDENARKINAPQFGWQASDESIIVFTREHKWSFFRVALLPFLVGVAAVVLAVTVAQSSPILATIVSVIAGLILFGVFIYLVLDWRDDYYVVTNKRIVHIDEIPLLRKKREEAPLSAVTEIQFARHSMLAHLLDFGDLRVETFSGMVGMKDIPHPSVVKNLIQREIERVRARMRASERNAIRDELTQRIIEHKLPTDRGEPPPLTAAPRPSSVFILGQLIRYFFPRLRETQGDAIIWRKHWVKLWETAWPPFVGMVAVTWATINWWNRWVPFGLLQNEAWWIWPVAFVGFFAWWLWLFEDWRNDQYILTSTRIIDIERVPFLLSEKRRESSLARIQTTEFKIPTPTARALGYGHLTLRVPGATFEFMYIKDPAGAQTAVNKRMSEFNKRQQENEARGRRNELSDWFAAYEQLRLRDLPPAGSAAATTPPAAEVVGDAKEYDNP